MILFLGYENSRNLQKNQKIYQVKVLPKTVLFRNIALIFSLGEPCKRKSACTFFSIIIPNFCRPMLCHFKEYNKFLEAHSLFCFLMKSSYQMSSYSFLPRIVSAVKFSLIGNKLKFTAIISIFCNFQIQKRIVSSLEQLPHSNFQKRMQLCEEIR